MSALSWLAALGIIASFVVASLMISDYRWRRRQRQIELVSRRLIGLPLSVSADADARSAVDTVSMTLIGRFIILRYDRLRLTLIALTFTFTIVVPPITLFLSGSFVASIVVYCTALIALFLATRKISQIALFLATRKISQIEEVRRRLAGNQATTRRKSERVIR